MAARQASTLLLSVGMLLAIITAGIDLSVGSILALSMCTMAVMAIEWHINPYLSMLACLAVGAGVGLTNGLLLTRLHFPIRSSPPWAR